MKNIGVCVGSACHLQGAYQVLSTFQRLIAEHGLEATVDIEGNFCQGNCTKGVVIKVDEELVFNVNGENAEEIFKKYILGG